LLQQRWQLKPLPVLQSFRRLSGQVDLQVPPLQDAIEPPPWFWHWPSLQHCRHCPLQGFWPLGQLYAQPPVPLQRADPPEGALGQMLEPSST
jgi:hypothetical protein